MHMLLAKRRMDVRMKILWHIEYLLWLGDSFIEASQVSPARQAVRVKVQGTEIGLETVLRLAHAVVQNTGEGGREGGREREREARI